VADGLMTMCGFNCNTGASVIGMQEMLTFQGHLWEVELRFKGRRGVRSGDYFSQRVRIRVQASGTLFQGNGTNSQISDHGAKYLDQGTKRGFTRREEKMQCECEQGTMNCDSR
jgi:hypothetical protein